MRKAYDGVFSGKYKNFFSKAPGDLALRITKYFDENEKNTVVDIAKNGHTYDTEKWQLLYKRNKTNPAVIYALLKHNDLPTEVRDNIVKNETTRNDPNKKIAWKLLDHYIPIRDDIEKLVNIIGHSALKMFLTDAEMNPQKHTICNENLQIIQQIVPLNTVDGHLFVPFISPLQYRTLLENIDELSEETITNIARCRNLNEKARDRIFDYGCLMQKIDNPTPHMIEEMYRSYVEALFDNHIEDAIEAKSIKNESRKLLCSMIRGNQLTETQELDLVHRLFVVGIKNDRTTFDIAQILAEHTQNIKVMEFLGQTLMEVLKNKNISEELKNLLCKKYVEEIKALPKEDIISQEHTIRQTTKLITYTEIGYENEEALRELINNNTRFDNIFVDSTNTTCATLQNIINREGKDDIRTIAAINLCIQQSTTNKELGELIITGIPFATYSIDNKETVIQDWEYSAIINGLDKLIESADENMYNKNILFSVKDGLRLAYQTRNITTKVCDNYIESKNLKIKEIFFKHCDIPNPNMTTEELKKITDTMSYHAIKDEINKIYRVLNALDDETEVYEWIDKYINIVDFLEEEQTRKHDELEKSVNKYLECR